MRAPGPPIPVRLLRHDLEPPDGIPVVSLPMTAHDRRRVRRLVGAADGAVLALELPTGTVLQPGQVLHQDAEGSYVVAAADEDVLVVRPHSIAEAARVAHLIGNMHRDIHVDGTEIIALADHTLADRIARLGAEVERARRPFQGRAPGEHAH
ncbi:MAG: urease accessory protein UreE [Acidobacteriota bacterium]